jgi:hypothetical protein
MEERKEKTDPSITLGSRITTIRYYTRLLATGGGVGDDCGANGCPESAAYYFK